MSSLIRLLGVWLFLAAGAIVADTRAQNAGGGPQAPRGGRSPSPELRGGPSNRTVDVKHIKALLTIDAQKREVRGTVVHTLSPLHPYLTRLDLDCGPKLRVSRVSAGPKAATCRKSPPRVAFCRSPSTAPTARRHLRRGDQLRRLPRHGLHFIMPDPAYPDRPLAIWTQGEAEDTHHWLPCYDYPNDSPPPR